MENTPKRMQLDYKEDIVIFEFDNPHEPMGLSLRGNSKEAKFKNAIIDINQIHGEEENKWVYCVNNPLIKNAYLNGNVSSYKSDKIWSNRVTKNLKLSEEDIQEFEFYVEDCFGLYVEKINYKDAVTERRNHFFGGE